VVSGESGVSVRALALPSRVLHGACLLTELDLQPVTASPMRSIRRDARCHRPVTDAPATAAKGTNLLKQRVLPEGAGSTGSARPSHITRHKIFWIGHNNTQGTK
jgi:hypothetical protein